VSKTAELDETIAVLNTLLAAAVKPKDKLLIADRLIRAYSLKLKFSDEGKGGKFAAPEQSDGPTTTIPAVRPN